MKVFAIIVTYNPKVWIDKCFLSLVSSNHPVEIIVVDNGSNDGSQEIIKNRFPNLIFIQNETNLGFGKANNIGIESAYKLNCDFFLLLNQDAWIEKDTISQLLNQFEQNQNFGIISPIHYDAEGKSLDVGFKTGSKINESDMNQDKLLQVSFINAAIWLISRNCIETVGGFNPIFFHYCEDNNYISRLIFHNIKFGVYCKSKGFHDRFYRTNNVFYKDNNLVLERDLAMSLSDPNINLSKTKIFVATIFQIIKNFFIDKKSLKFNIIYLKSLLKINTTAIISFREISKTTNHAFLDI